MTTQLKISIHTLATVNKIVQGIYIAKPTLNTLENVQRSIGFGLAEKLEKKCKEVVKKHNNLFDSKKEISITFKFHEAWALEKILASLECNCENDLEKVQVRKVIFNINQKQS